MENYSTETLGVILTIINNYPSAIRLINTKRIPTNLLEDFIKKNPEEILYVPEPTSSMIVNTFIYSYNTSLLVQISNKLTEGIIYQILDINQSKIHSIPQNLRTLEMELFVYGKNKFYFNCVRTLDLFESEENYHLYTDEYIKDFLRMNYEKLKFSITCTRIKRLLLESSIKSNDNSFYTVEKIL